MSEIKPIKRCCICKQYYAGYGNNALPVQQGLCCEECNSDLVIPERLRLIANGKVEEEEYDES